MWYNFHPKVINSMLIVSVCFFVFEIITNTFLHNLDICLWIKFAETFECPEMYVKCPNSFCIAVKHICDGTKNCPGGEDEENCCKLFS